MSNSTPKMMIPVYFDTQDQRIIEWVNKNMTHHNLAKSVKPTNDNKKEVLGEWIASAAIGVSFVILLYVFMMIYLGMTGEYLEF